MVSPKPVPSRAALNALRGLVFTTSCSVVLLAEERRRRSKLARSAIDNARKLHTVKARRRPVAAVDSQLSDTDLELFDLHRASGAPSRKKRTRKNPESKSTAGDARHAEHERGLFLSSSILAQSPDTLQKELSPDKVLRDSIDFLETRLAQINTNVSSTSRHKYGQDFHRTAALKSSLRPSDFSRPTKKQEANGGNSRVSSRSSNQVELAEKQMADELSAEAVAYLQSLPPQGSSGSGLDEIAFTLLRRLLNGLESSSTGHELALTYQSLSLELFKNMLLRLRSMTNSRQARKLRFHYLKFLKVVVQSQEVISEEIVNTIEPLYSSVLQLAVPLLHDLNESGSRNGMRRALQILSKSNLSFTVDNNSISEIIDHHLRRYEDLGATCRFYNALHDGELSSVIDISPSTHYKIHRQLLDEACIRGDDVMCVEHAEKLGQIDHKRASRCGSICIATLYLGLASGRPVSIDNVLQQIDQANLLDSKKMPSSLAALTALTDRYAEHVSAPELEILIRTLAKKSGMALKYTWVHSIAEYHADHLDQDSMLSWLRFSVHQGYRAAPSSLHKWARKFVHSWQASDEELARLFENLQGPRRTNSSREGWETGYIRRSENLLRTESSRMERIDFEDMQTNAFQGNWQSVWAKYEARLASDTHSSLRCFRLAVLARLKLDDGATETTTKLIRDAKLEGQDVCPVLTPLLMAQLAEGRDPDVTIRDALQPDYQIQDMIYNKAASVAAASDDRATAIKICKMAVQHNGSGDLLYNPYIFAHLLFGYTGLEQYDALASLVSRFMKEKRWWAGTKIALQSLKLAMKAVAKRAATARSRLEVQQCEKMLRQLTDAHQHGFDCKQTPDENITLVDSLADIYKVSMELNSKDGEQSDTKKVEKSQKGSRARTPSKSRNWVYSRPSLRYTTVKTKSVRQKVASDGFENHVNTSPRMAAAAMAS